MRNFHSESNKQRKIETRDTTYYSKVHCVQSHKLHIKQYLLVDNSKHDNGVNFEVVSQNISKEAKFIQQY